MNEKDLRDIIAQVLSEMNVTDTTSATSAAPAQKADTASAATEDGFVEDVAEVDIKKQYLVGYRQSRCQIQDLTGTGIPCSTFRSTGCRIYRRRSRGY